MLNAVSIGLLSLLTHIEDEGDDRGLWSWCQRPQRVESVEHSRKRKQLEETFHVRLDLLGLQGCPVFVVDVPLIRTVPQ